MTLKFNVNFIKLKTKVEGPYDRCCIWFQGCNICCKGCCNKALQEFKPVHILTLDELLDVVKEAKTKYNIEGVTLSGGEPSLQIGLNVFNDRIHEMGLGIIMFSGHYIDELDPILVNSVDLLIAGPFIEEQYDNDRILIGSKNKNIHFITDRYKKNEDYFYKNESIEEIELSNKLFINGD